MKAVVSFSAKSVFFGVHRTAMFNIFYNTLENLAATCRDFIPWPTQEEVLLKAKY